PRGSRLRTALKPAHPQLATGETPLAPQYVRRASRDPPRGAPLGRAQGNSTPPVEQTSASLDAASSSPAVDTRPWLSRRGHDCLSTVGHGPRLRIALSPPKATQGRRSPMSIRPRTRDDARVVLIRQNVEAPQHVPERLRVRCPGCR